MKREFVESSTVSLAALTAGVFFNEGAILCVYVFACIASNSVFSVRRC